MTASPRNASETLFLRYFALFADYMGKDFIGGPRLFRQSHIINFQKGGTLFFVLALMFWYDVWTPTAWTYLALHGSYGFCWILKETTFPDPKWQSKMTIFAAIPMFGLVLGPYWMMSWFLISENNERTPMQLAGASVFYVLGLALMLGADAQKYFVLKHKKGLITDGFFARIRHPNYLGEMMLYASFAYVSGDPLSFGILGYVWICFFIPFMLQKEASMSRYPEWAAYTKRAGFLFPKLTRRY